MTHAGEVKMARIFKKRLFLQNPLLHPDIWPLRFTDTRCGSDWTELTFGQLDVNDVIGFPKI